jgi:hypothetical protein
MSRTAFVAAIHELESSKTFAVTCDPLRYLRHFSKQLLVFFFFFKKHHLCKGLWGRRGIEWQRVKEIWLPPPPPPLNPVLYARQCLNHCFTNFSARGPFLASKNNQGFSHPCSRKECPGDSHPELKMYTSELILDIRILTHTSSTRNNALHDMTLIKVVVDRFVGTGSFLIEYCNGHTK